MDFLMDQASELLDQARNLEEPSSLRPDIESLRDEVEVVALSGEGGEAPGLLNECLASLLLFLRASSRSDTALAADYLEQATLFLDAARQSSAP